MANIQISIPYWLDRICSWPVLLYRKHKYGSAFRKIDLGRGQFTILDPQDYYRFGNFKWWVHSNGSNLYAARTEITEKLQSKIIYLHRMICDPPDGLVVDHRFGNTLDNRRENLRLATHSQNMRNRRKIANTSSRFIGVWLDKKRNKWTAQIRYNGKKLWLGRFSSELAAAKAYDTAAKKYYCEFARLNNV
jgi:hypothetical protein